MISHFISLDLHLKKIYDLSTVLILLKIYKYFLRIINFNYLWIDRDFLNFNIYINLKKMILILIIIFPFYHFFE